MKRVMIDFETLGTSSRACLLQVGACEFNLFGEIPVVFVENINPRDSVRHGTEIDLETVLFWLNQSDEARSSVIISDEVVLPETQEKNVLVKLNDFLAGAREIWSHANFDWVILNEALRRNNIKPSFHYSSCRDIRTLMSLTKYDIKKDIKRTGIRHNALDDCIYQVKYCVAAINSLGGINNDPLGKNY